MWKWWISLCAHNFKIEIYKNIPMTLHKIFEPILCRLTSSTIVFFFFFSGNSTFVSGRRALKYSNSHPLKLARGLPLQQFAPQGAPPNWHPPYWDCMTYCLQYFNLLFRFWTSIVNYYTIWELSSIWNKKHLMHEWMKFLSRNQFVHISLSYILLLKLSLKIQTLVKV